MAKDSTAVQRLIELAQQKPIDVDLGGLFDGEPPRRAAALPSPRSGSMQPASAPPPLPRRPSGTQTALSAIPAGTPAPERIERFAPAELDAPADLAAAPRVTGSSGADFAAADELFGNKPLPPLPQARPAAPPPPAALPPPRRSAQQATALPPPPVQAAPAMAPLPRAPFIADELPTSPVTLAEAEGVDEGAWFQQSEAVPMVDEFGTQSVLKSRGSAAVAIAAAFGLGLIVAGGYIVYSRLSTTPPKPVPASSVASRINAASSSTAAKAAPAQAAPARVASASAPAVAAAAPAQVAPEPAIAPAPAAAAPPTVTPIEPAPAPERAAAAVPAAAAPVTGALVDVTLKSDPSGVTVMLIDGGGAVKLGKTPTVASLSAGTQHQILFSRDGYSATMATIDPAAQTDVMVALAPTPGSHAQPAVAIVQPAPTAPTAPIATPIETAPAPAPKHQHVATAPAPKHETAPKHAAPAPAPVQHVSHAQVTDEDDNPINSAHKAAPKRAATATATSGTGTLMIGAKPPCDIIIDGRATGLTTPQRSINLQPGSHSITLVNRANNIKKSFSVSINSGSPTKVVKDFTSLIKK